MRMRTLLVVVVMLASWAAPVGAQGNFSAVTPFGHNPAQDQAAQEPAMLDNDSGAAFLDNAVPHTTIRTRFDLASRFRQPTRAEYFWAKGGLGSPGPVYPETKVDYQEFRTYGEFALNTWFSVFMESPYRFLNPEVNSNTRGMGDMNFGFKFAFLSDAVWVSSFQLRAYVPTGARGLGNDHYTLEPGLLINYRFADQLILEGEIKYWVPIHGTDYAGNILQYGVGLMWGQRTYGEMWLAPVVEGIGYTILSGKSSVASSPFVDASVDAEGTIVNAALGIRMGWSIYADWYIGYNRCLSGTSWHRDMVRVEFRYQF